MTGEASGRSSAAMASTLTSVGTSGDHAATRLWSADCSTGSVAGDDDEAAEEAEMAAIALSTLETGGAPPAEVRADAAMGLTTKGGADSASACLGSAHGPGDDVEDDRTVG